MLIIFRSKVGDITMFGDVGKQMLALMGASGGLPGALLAADIPPAVARLRAGVAAQPTPKPQDDRDDDERNRPVALAVRAKPLIDMLERAAKAGVDVMWEQDGK